MRSQTFILSGNSSDFTTSYKNTIHLNRNKKYEAALLSIDLFNSFPNITEKNNVFKYSTDNGSNWKVIRIDTGSYQLSAINDEIQRLMIINGDYDSTNDKFYITISANTSKLTSLIEITNQSYKIDFAVENSLGPTLGFQKIILNYGYNVSTNIVDIIKINIIHVNLGIISGAYDNGVQSPVIYSFYPNVSPGYKIVERPNPSLIYCPINISNINSMRLWLTDQDNNLVDVRGGRVDVKIKMREVTKKLTKEDIKEVIKELKEENIL